MLWKELEREEREMIRKELWEELEKEFKTSLRLGEER